MQASLTESLSNSFLHMQYTDTIILRTAGLVSQSHWPSSLHSINESHQTSGRNSSTKMSVLRTVQIFTFFPFTAGLFHSQGYNSALSNVFLHSPHNLLSPVWDITSSVFTFFSTTIVFTVQYYDLNVNKETCIFKGRELKGPPARK